MNKVKLFETDLFIESIEPILAKTCKMNDTYLKTKVYNINVPELILLGIISLLFIWRYDIDTVLHRIEFLTIKNVVTDLFKFFIVSWR